MLQLTRRSRLGFTLLEIMLVVAIISLLLGSAIYFVKDHFIFSAIVRVKADCSTIGTTLVAYRAQTGSYPTTQQGLAALSAGHGGYPPLIDEMPTDPWQKEYCYVSPGTRNPRGYDLFSAGPDQKPGTPDDVYPK